MAQWANRHERLKPSVTSLVPTLLGLTTVLLILLALLAGVNNSLTALYYFKVDVSQLSVPSSLAGSEFLQDLTSVSDIDLVGQEATASSLGLAQTYTVNILNSCADFPSKTACSAPNLKLNFSPGSDLHLDGTGYRVSDADSYSRSLARYGNSHRFIAPEYIIAAVATLLAATLSLAGNRSKGTAFVTLALSGLGAGFLLGANVAATINAQRIVKAINANFSDAGVNAKIAGGGIPITWTAFALSLVSTIILAVRLYRWSPSSSGPAPREWVVLRHNAGKSGGGKAGNILVTGRDAYEGAGADRTAQSPVGQLLNRVSTWGQHKYVQVEKQLDVGRERRFESEMERHDRWASDQSEPRHVGGRPEYIPMGSMADNREHGGNLESYEPYRSNQRG